MPQKYVNQKMVEEALKESEERFKKLFMEAPMGVALIDSLTGHIYEVNPMFAKIAGRTMEEMLQIDWMSITHPDDVQKDIDNMALMNAGKTNGFQMEKRYLHHDGAAVWISMTIAPAKVEDTSHPRHLCMIEDITDRKQLEKALSDINARYSAIFDQSPIAIEFYDADGRLVHVNDACIHLFGVMNINEISGFKLFEDPNIPGNIKTKLLNSEPVRFEVEFNFEEVKRLNLYQTSCSGIKTLDWSITPLTNGNLVSGYIQQIQDISERNQAEKALRESEARFREVLEQRVIERTGQLKVANQELESFAYSVSHDLRAPLRSIDGFSLALLEDYEDKLDEGGKDYLRRVRAAAQKMAQLIDDILKLSRITRCELTFETVNLSDLAGIIADELRSVEPERRVEFVITKGLTTQGDSRLLKVVLDNLIGNAWKFTGSHAEARIEFGSSKVDGKTAYYIRDDGVGFDTKYADKLFVTFQRLHTEQEFSGVGIGLSLVQRITHRHGGAVWAEGAVEQGATFWFTVGG